VLRHGGSPGSAIPRVYSDRAAAEAYCSLYVLICQRLIQMRQGCLRLPIIRSDLVASAT
jgi:hypothetical protein